MCPILCSQVCRTASCTYNKACISHTFLVLYQNFPSLNTYAKQGNCCIPLNSVVRLQELVFVYIQKSRAQNSNKCLLFFFRTHLLVGSGQQNLVSMEEATHLIHCQYLVVQTIAASNSVVEINLVQQVMGGSGEHMQKLHNLQVTNT